METSRHQLHPRLSTGSAKRVSLHPAERVLIILVLIHLIFLPWALGTMRLWAQIISIVLAALIFIVALIPRSYTDENSRTGSHYLSMWPRLLRFPLFWIGALLLIYIAIQGLNPAWRYVSTDQGWWMTRITYINWLPHGTESPLDWANPWRALMIYGSAWLLMCSLWIGITRRRALQVILVGLVSNGLLLAIVAAAQRLTGTNKILWFVDSPNQIWGTFFYRNHGAAWFGLMVSLFCGLAFWHYLKALRTFAKSSPAALYGFLSFLMIVIVIAGYSRGAVISTLLFLGLFIITFLVRQFTLPAYPQKNVITVFLILLVAGFTFVGLQGLNAKNTWDRMEKLFEGETKTMAARRSATQATFDMWKASPWLGHGAHSFRFIFPVYQQHYPTIWKAGKRRLYWEHAHNDIAQTSAELGIVGVSFIVLGWLWALGRFVRTRAWANPLSITLLLGMICTAAHSWGEFVFQNPAILITWVSFGVISLRWAELDPTVQLK